VSVRSVVVSGSLPSNTAADAWCDRGCRPPAAQDRFGAWAAGRKARLPPRQRKVSVVMSVYQEPVPHRSRSDLARLPWNANDFRALAYLLAGRGEDGPRAGSGPQRTPWRRQKRQSGPGSPSRAPNRMGTADPGCHTMGERPANATGRIVLQFDHASAGTCTWARNCPTCASVQKHFRLRSIAPLCRRIL
jgi:hypothetical protein